MEFKYVILLMLLIACVNTISASNMIFYDNFENWSGWANYGSGTVYQSNEQHYSGNYSLKKDNNNDPNGGYKNLSEVVGRDVVISGWIYRPSNYSSGSIDRLGLEDENFNGYTIAVSHGSNKIWTDKRTNGGAATISNKISWNPPEDEWYKFKLYIYSNGTITLSTYYNNGTLGATVSTNDNTYNSFDRVVIHGGYQYYVDDLEVVNLSSPLKIKYVEKFNSVAVADGNGELNYSSGGLVGHFIIENTAPYIDDTLHDVWVVVNISDNITPLRVVYNGTPKGVYITNNAPSYTGINGKGTDYIHISELPNNSYVDCAFDINPSKTLPITINETYSTTKIPAHYNQTYWNVKVDIIPNKDVIGNNTVYVNFTKYLSNNSFYEDFNNWSNWHQYGTGIINWSSNFSHSKNHSLWKGNDNTSDSNYNDPSGGYYILPKQYNRTISLQGWIYRPYASSWAGPIDRVGLEDENFNGYTIAVSHSSNEIWIDKRTNGGANSISNKISWNPPENEWYKFKLYIYSNGTITLKIYNESMDYQKEVSANDNTYKSFDRIVIRGGHPYYVDDLRVIPSNDGFYGDENWSMLNITNMSYNRGNAYTFDGEYFNSFSNALKWYNISLNNSQKAEINFTIHGIYNGNISKRDGALKRYGFAVVEFNYNGISTNSSIKGVYASGIGSISTIHGSDDEYHWNETATFKNKAKSYNFNLTSLNIWAVNKSAYHQCWDPFDKSIWITRDNGYDNDSNHSLTPNIELEPSESWNTLAYNFTFDGVPIVWANCSFKITNDDYSITRETGGMGNKYIVIEKILVVGSYMIKVTKHIIPNADGTYDMYIVVENIGSETSPFVYAYDLIPQNFSIVGSISVNRTDMLNNTGNHSVSDPRYNMSVYWALNPLNGGADGDGSYNDTSEITNSKTVVIHYTINGTGVFNPSDAFIVGIDPTHSLLPTTSPKITLVSGAIADNYEPLLMLLSGLVGVGCIIRRRKNN
ncbi:conserved hypothetical protein [Methanococcus aeolicus Nankai-3]|uniref:DUF2341 domain-containing protein n=1 Tax=Methanococcus aeolicus (strain ATCC BAA-1280 / DSM 17508 / OCM 812 / Nankai-3) TaxID=419665 RepID=A6UVX2_META3|nr:hypothetical protein [Methanococcus aeolicus]ABR56644.1 conserved hypothetical protein [Methanococcus aeolicus Nankai-3]